MARGKTKGLPTSIKKATMEEIIGTLKKDKEFMGFIESTKKNIEDFEKGTISENGLFDLLWDFSATRVASWQVSLFETDLFDKIDEKYQDMLIDLNLLL